MSDKVKKSLCLLAHELRDPEDSVDSIFKKRKGKTSNRKSAKADEDEPSYITANLYMPLVCSISYFTVLSRKNVSRTFFCFFIFLPLMGIGCHRSFFRTLT